MVMDEVRKYMEAAMGAMGKLTPAKAQDLARSLTKGQGRDQMKKTARDLLEWSNRNRERMTDLIRSEVRSQVKTLGLATRDDVDALRKRVRDLERAGSAPKKRSTAKRKTAAKRTPSTASRATAAAPATPTAGAEG